MTKNIDLKKHLEEEHKVSASSQYIGELVYGGVDGIVTTFAVVSGFMGAGASDQIGQIGAFAVILFGLANLFGDGVSMALGQYLATKSEQDIYKTAWEKEQYEIKHNTAMEIEECIHILEEQGMNNSDAQKMVTIMKAYPKLWIKRMMDNEIELPDVRGDNATIQGLITLFSFLVFGAIPLLPFFFVQEEQYWPVSLIATASALVLLGVTRRYVTRQNFFWTVGQIVLLGAVAAAVAYFTGMIVIGLH